MNIKGMKLSKATSLRAKEKAKEERWRAKQKRHCKITIVHVDYAPCEKCRNPDTFGMICVKCGECGRKFNDCGVCTNIEEYPPERD